MESSPIAAGARRGDREEMARLVAANTGLVIYIAKEYRNRGVPFEDLVAEGFVGLLEAIARFDPAAGARLTTYAGFWVRKRVLQAVADQSHLIRIPRHARERGVQARRTHSLDARHLDDGAPHGATLHDPDAPRPIDGLILAERRKRLRATFIQLPARERAVLVSRFGLGGDRARTLIEVGAQLGLSHERVRQIEAAALSRLREAIEAAPQPPRTVVRIRSRAAATVSSAYDSKAGTLQNPVA